jgi:hypothetical protein
VSPGAATGLPLMYPIMSQEMADYFNNTARPGDLALFLGQGAAFIPSVHAGQKVMVWKSWAAMQQELPGLVGQIDLVAYNPEHNSPTPQSELDSLPATVQAAYTLAHNNGLKLMVVPDRQLDDQYVTQVAPYSDIFVLQGQRLEGNLNQFARWVAPKVSAVHTANPGARVYVQVGTAMGSPQQMLAALNTVDGQIDGIGVWTSPQETLGPLQEFQHLVRPG